jgi:hypothetical protein
VPNVQVNGLPVLEARLTLPRTGAWSAELVIDVLTAQQLGNGGPAAITIADDNATDPLSFSGTILRSDAYAEGVSLRVQGGKRGLNKTTSPRFYSSVQAGQPLTDILGDGGESASSTSNATAVPLPFWTLIEQRVSQALSLLATSAGDEVVWRVLPDGTIFFGTDAFQATALTEFELIDYRPLDGFQVLASELPDLYPGESFNGFNVDVVEHVVNAKGNRARVWFQ